jgi:Dolichyl-phosphate-mannose-protein mannosyltransferase
VPALRAAWPWLVGGVALTLANAWLIWGDVNQFDESWTLQIVHRLAGGEALYRDVHFTVTPLSIYLLWAVVAVTGQQILVVKLLSALLAAGSALLVARIARQAGVSVFGAVVCVLVALPLSPAFSISLYTPLAMFLFLGCESLTLDALHRRSVAWIAAAGGCAGLSFAAKQNVGGLAASSLFVAVVLVEPTRRGLRRLLVATLAFGAVTAGTLVAMVVTGGVHRTLDALGLAKGAYLSLGAVSYRATFVSQLETLARVGAWRDLLVGNDRDLLLASPRAVLPVVTAVLLAAAWMAWWRRGGMRRVDASLAVVTVFAVASFAAAYPRYEAVHLGWTAGPLIAACATALGRLNMPIGRAAQCAVAALAIVWSIFVLAGPVADWRSGRVHMGLPHFAGAWTSSAQRDRAVETVQRLDRGIPSRRAFLVVGEASFYYLSAGIENPTRFDYPAATVIGRREADEIVRDVRAGTVTEACLADEPPAASDLRPLELEERLRRILRPGPDLGLCRLWLRRP